MDQSVAEGNLVIDNSRGLFFFNSDRNVFFANDIVDNDLAVQINGSCEENEIYGNNFMGNLNNVLVDNDRSKTQWTHDGRGNYWSDYDGYDLDGDGVGDVPHKVQNVFQVIETEIPEIRLFLLSPAAKILKTAERALPILGLGSEKDPQPLFRTIPNVKAPWNLIETIQFKSSLISTLLYAFGSFTPLLILLYLSRRKQSGKDRT